MRAIECSRRASSIRKRRRSTSRKRHHEAPDRYGEHAVLRGSIERATGVNSEPVDSEDRGVIEREQSRREI